MGGLRQFFVSAALLALSACGSGESGSNTNPQPAPSAYAYVASAGAGPSSAGAIYEYGILSDSSVAPLPQSSISAGIYPAAVVIGQGHVYAVNVGDGTISQYNVASDGTLTPMNPATVTNPAMHTFGAAPAAATIDPTGSFLYVTNAADNTLSQFSIGSDGQLTPLTPSTVATGVDPVSIVVAPVADSTPGYYVVNSGAPGDTGTVSLYSSGEDGTLTPVDSDTVAAGTNPSAIAVNNAFSTAYVMSNCDGAQCTGSIRQFAVGASGALTDTGAIATTGSHYDAVNMVINQDGANAYAYVLSNAMRVDSNAGALWEYGVESTGELTPASSPMLNIGPVAVAQAIDVVSLYVLTTNSGANANTGSTGGNINFYSLGVGGAATLTATTKISAPQPVTMGVRFLLAP
jgi:6-phosphogluconolactonase (cycloisomerase 2 family)